MKRFFNLLLLVALPFCLKAQEGIDVNSIERLPSWEELVQPEKLTKNVISHSRQLAKSEVATFDEELAPFYHGVASGDPLSDRVIIWTRVTPDLLFDGVEIPVSWRMATDPELTDIVAEGEFSTNMDRDYTVKVDVTGLEAGTTYYYGFTAFDAHSLTGRTKTVTTGSPDNLRFGVTSCSHYQQGFFNAYGNLAEQLDLDAIFHLGDYIYEYGTYSDFLEEGDTVFPRPHDPENEIISLEDYRTRHSLYKLDPNLRKVHQQFPFINIWDDHETANDSWKDGAQNHDPATEGDWETRKNNGIQAFFEWLPVREAEGGGPTKIYRTFKYGDLVDFIMIDTRLEGRMKQAENEEEQNDPNRTLLGAEQYDWLVNELNNSTAKWTVLGNQVIFTPVNLLGLPGSEDMWNGYPAEREKLIEVLKNIDNFIIITGDFHMGIAADITPDPGKPGESIGAEFVVPSISTANVDELEDLIREVVPTIDINAIDDLAKTVNRQLKYFNTFDHGFYILDVKTNQAQVDFYYTESILEEATGYRQEGSYVVKDQESFLTEVEEAAPSAEAAPAAPADPPLFIHTGIKDRNAANSSLIILAHYPNPAIERSDLVYALSKPMTIKAGLYDVSGKLVKNLFQGQQQAGVYSLRAEVGELAAGIYFFQIETEEGRVSKKLIVE